MKTLTSAAPTRVMSVDSLSLAKVRHSEPTSIILKSHNLLKILK